MVMRRVSVQISSSAVRMAEVSAGHGRPELVRLGQVALPPRAVIDGVILDVPTVRVAVERCVKEGGFSAGDVHLGIAGLRDRKIEMPLVPDSEIDGTVRTQAPDVIPFSIDRALISAQALEETVGPSGMPMRRVLVAAAHRDLVDPLIQIVTAAGLNPISVETTSSAMIRALFDPETAIDKDLKQSSPSAPGSRRWPCTRRGSPISSGRLPKVAMLSPRRSQARSACRCPTPKQ